MSDIKSDKNQRPLTMTPETENNGVAVRRSAAKPRLWDEWTGSKWRESEIIRQSADLEGK